MTKTEQVAIGVAAIGLLAGAIWLLVPGSSPRSAPTTSTTSIATALATATVATAPTLTAATTTSATASARASAMGATLRLTDPRATVDTQIELLTSNRDDELRATFMPNIREKLTPQAIATCKRKVESHPVRPDWEMAEEATVDGRRVRRVSMFGKSMTGFVEARPNVWLADDVWCVQGQLP